MTDSEVREHSTSRVVMISIAVAVVALLVAGVVYLAWSTSSNGDSNQQKPETNNSAAADSSSEGNEGMSDSKTPVTPGSTNVLPEAMTGQDAIDALGENIDRVAAQNNFTVEELEALLLRDATAHVSTSGHIYYRDAAPKSAAD